MRRIAAKCRLLLAALLALVMVSALTAYGSQDDNSLYDLGITTEGATVTPDFQYDIWTYDVKVPAGTTELTLDPVPSSSAATISDISGTTLDAEGNATVFITVRAGSGSEFTYTLNVSADGEAAAAPEVPQTEAPQPAQTETQAPETEPATEPQTEDSRFVKVDRNTIQEAENTISSLKGEISTYRDTISLYTKIMYGLIALAVILLFVVINLILRKRDIKAELNEYKSLGYGMNQKGPQGRAPMPQQPVMRPQQGAAGPQQGAASPAGTSQQGAAQPQMRAPQYYPQGGQLDVMPQTSQKKARRLPQYEQTAPQTGAAPVQSAARQPLAGEVQAQGVTSDQGTAQSRISGPQGEAGPVSGTSPQQGALSERTVQTQAQTPAAGTSESGDASQPQQSAQPQQNTSGRQKRSAQKAPEINMIDL